ncbi:TorF family putative porin [Tahibacter amnicola]|uniref:TorF family putative porin n=1 Tax=Tahibacter amnicola TaxID=2976241 RepID=A0ABY6BJ66_9GAMM|nr:TorF family putative porin [Tahibacter amnicola]UXI69140.1 TorF family putative porin [Tahibacter amnicola]
MKKAALWVAIAGIALAGTAAAQEESSSPHKFAFTAAITSDYVFRGVSQNQEDPAIQGGVTYSHESGFYAGVWGSAVDFTPDNADYDDGADMEVDTFIGYNWGINEDWKLDLQFIRYNYPGTEDGYDYDYNELLTKIIFKENYSLLVGYSNDVFATDETGIYYGLSGSWELPHEFILSATLGHYDLDDSYDHSYTETVLGVKRTWGHFTVALSYSDTSGGGEDIFGKLADDRVILTLSADF